MSLHFWGKTPSRIFSDTNTSEIFSVTSFDIKSSKLLAAEILPFMFYP
jgi:hypothetical protein